MAIGTTNYCSCCGARTVSSAGCDRCAGGTWCGTCGLKLACPCGHQISDHRCPSIVTVGGLGVHEPGLTALELDELNFFTQKVHEVCGRTDAHSVRNRAQLVVMARAQLLSKVFEDYARLQAEVKVLREALEEP